MYTTTRFTPLAVSTGLLLASVTAPAHAQDSGSFVMEDSAVSDSQGSADSDEVEARSSLEGQDDVFVIDSLVITAEEQARQALGVSQLTAEDLARTPIVNDVSEVIRKMPGVNLTGATATGQRGNQRQIDIRGMGPENTLILIDGKPVLSRNSVKMSRGGERDTRGDSNWVPAELIERVEVLRGPAAARYGSGSSGGVVNIITRKPDTFTTRLSTSIDVPESSLEGRTYRGNLMVAGPINDELDFRVFANYSKTEADDPDINYQGGTYIDDDGVVQREPPLAGMEGVTNKDVGALLRWQVAPGHELDLETGFSRQGNIYAGDSRNGTVQETVGDLSLIGEETNRLYRANIAATHRGEYAFGESNTYLQWENTRNSRLCAGTAGGGEDNITNCVDTDGDGEDDATAFGTITLNNVNAKSEWKIPVKILARNSRVTLGAEYRGEYLDDAVSIRGGLDESLAEAVGVDPDGENRDSKTDQFTVGPYVEANVEWNEKLTLTPALRFDYNDNFGESFSPSLNATYAISSGWTMKLGVARAFKTPNLYQLNTNFVYVTRGNGCPYFDGVQVDGPCYVLGNPDLEAEHSLNKEIGFSYNTTHGLDASLTWFHNDYTNRIGSGFVQYNEGAVENRLYRWENQDEAIISGLEGSISMPLGSRIGTNVNFTHIMESENKADGQPLSLVPEYTINASVDWYATDDVSVALSATHYGKIESAGINSTTNAEFDNTDSRDQYTLVNLGATWKIARETQMSTGVTNLFDKSVLRTGEGANTYNEPGRAYYLKLSHSF